MVYVCPYCGKKSYEKQLRCEACQKDLALMNLLHNKSEIYYIKAYEEAEERNLSLAISHLRQALAYNKYHTKARNLLGLIYFEVGRIGDALKEWIVSSALDKEDEVAPSYIEQVQKSPKAFMMHKEANFLYNKAFKYLEEDNVDVAMIRLKKAVGISPRFVEARVLLGLCYMQLKQFYKANEQIKAALRIDKGHVAALRYFKALSVEDTETMQPYEIEYISRHNHAKRLKPAKIMDRGAILMRYVLYFVVGGLCMLVVDRTLINPTEIKVYKEEISRLKSSEEELAAAIKSLGEEKQLTVATLEEKYQKLSIENEVYERLNSQMNQREKLRTCETLKEEKNYIEAAKILYNVASSVLEGEDVTRYEGLRQEVYSKAATELCQKGYISLEKEEWDEAKTVLETALLYEPDAETTKKSLYYLGRTYKGLGHMERAKYYFEKVVSDYPETKEANWAKSRISELAEF